MAATQTQPGSDRIETLSTITVDDEEKTAAVGSMKEQTLSAKDEKITSSTNAVELSIDAPSHMGALDTGGNQTGAYPPNIYAPQAQTFLYEGYENPTGEWEEYPRYINAEGIEVGSPGIYNENPSLLFHTGYGYSPQMPYGPYSPVTTPLPNASGDGQLYSPQHYPFAVHYYQQPSSPSMSYLNSPTQQSQADLSMPIDQQGAYLAGNSNSNGMLGPRPGYQHSYDSFGRVSDWSTTPDGTGSLISSPAASPQSIGALGSFEQNISPFPSGMASPQHRSSYGFGPSINSYDRGYYHGGMYHQNSSFGGSIPSFGYTGRSLIANDKSRRRGKGNSSLCSCNGTPDFLSEQNRGPRATRPKNSITEQNSSHDGTKEKSIVGPDRGLYNKPDFVTEYKDAKFFIIKSYSEDNVHKSIKYGVWASTANGNRKLDSSYREAKRNGDPCPIFLFFSVNASAQFCGVAEMIGPVDFERSVDYWQQDKWSGQFPVKWHIVKDVPNNLFRHIILENNDNKPVTNSRDTQEVSLEQGLEMLTILKKHESDMSILDDFDFYEERQKAMQETRARQQQQKQPNSTGVFPAGAGSEQGSRISNTVESVNHLSKSFADAVRLQGSSVEKDVSRLPTEKNEVLGESTARQNC